MKIVILQTDIVWNDKLANIEIVDSILKNYTGIDLFVLPEMFSTGFCLNPEGIAEKSGSRTLEWMKNTSQEKQCAIAGSIAWEDDGRFYNRFYFVHPGGTVEWYDKKHLFAYGGENKEYTAGNKRLVVSYKGVRFLLQVCYDLRFPVWSRNRNDYDVALYVANWPSSRIDVWKSLLKARAIENQSYVVGVNRVGTGDGIVYSGGSSVINPYGKVIATCEDNIACEAVVEIDMNELESFRKKFPVLNDADPFEIM